MTRYEFTERLRAALMGEVPDSVVEENIRFYERYISDEMASGKDEAEVLSGLGDPRLIAKTISETWQGQDSNTTYYSQEATAETYESVPVYEESYQQDRSGAGDGGSYFNMNGKVYRLDKWYLKLIPIAIVLLILAFVLLIVFGTMTLVIAILTSPFFWGMILLMAVWRWIFGRR